MLGTFPMHKRIGRTNYNSINLNKQKLGPLMIHLEHLTKLGEVRATQSVIATTLVNGTVGLANWDDDDEVIYLPRYMGYCNYYKQFVALLCDSVLSMSVNVNIVE